MIPADPPRIERLRDGTVWHRNPITGDEALSVPARRHRPFATRAPRPGEPIAPRDPEDACDFCPARMLRTPPEKARLVREAVHAPPRESFAVPGYRRVERRPAGELDRDRAAFRCVANLFEIVTLDSFVERHGYEPPPELEAWRDAYLRDPEGERHVRALLAYRDRCAGDRGAGADALDREALRRAARPLFLGSHDLVIAERHHARDARTTRDLAGSGHLGPDAHHAYVAFTLRRARDIEERNLHVRSVAVFQNWRRRAGASFDHLHKQLLGLDRAGALLDRKIDLARRDPDALVRLGPEHARAQDLVALENNRAVAYVEVGERFPTLTVMSLAPEDRPERMDPRDLRALSDLLHAAHRALGPAVPTNEEWQIRPRGCDASIPLHVHLRLREANTAGFEGVTRIHVWTESPWEVRDRFRSDGAGSAP